MRPYGDLSGGITHTHQTADGITVRFKNGAEYHYTNKDTGANHVREMKRLERMGVGLHTYIVQKKPKHARKTS